MKINDKLLNFVYGDLWITWDAVTVKLCCCLMKYVSQDKKKIKFCFRKERAALYSHRKPKVRLNGLLLDYMEATSGGVSLCFTLPAAAQYIVAFLALVKKKSMLDTSL